MQAGVLATALIAGTVGCSNAAGGNEITNNNGGNGQGQGGTQTGYTKPDYMNVTAEFGGQRFAEGVVGNDCFYDNPNKNANFESYYKNAKEFMAYETNNLQELVNSSNNNSTLSNQINTLLQKYNKERTIATDIDKNYTALAPIFKEMKDFYKNKNDVQNFHGFNVSYWQLAADAYNQSLGAYAGEEDKKSFTTNAELRADDIAFTDALGCANISYQDATNSAEARNRMNGYLSTIANETNTDVKVLKKIVELALYNESLYGLNDHAVKCAVSATNLNYQQRSLTDFTDKMNNVSMANMQSLDDRTM